MDTAGRDVCYCIFELKVTACYSITFLRKRVLVLLELTKSLTKTSFVTHSREKNPFCGQDLQTEHEKGGNAIAFRRTLSERASL